MGLGSGLGFEFGLGKNFKQNPNLIAESLFRSIQLKNTANQSIIFYLKA
jgi:hypothetical protein